MTMMGMIVVHVGELGMVGDCLRRSDLRNRRWNLSQESGPLMERLAGARNLKTQAYHPEHLSGGAVE
jgi:hypothetical protein